MNIVFVYDRQIIPSFGGLERVTHLLAQELKSRGHAVTFLNIGSEDNLQEEIGEIEQLYLPVYSLPEETFRKEFQKLLDNFGADIVIYQGNSKEILKCIQVPVQGVAKISAIHFQPFPTLKKEHYIKRRAYFSDLRLKGKILKIMALTMTPFYRKLYIRDKSALYSLLIQNSDKLVLLSPRFKDRLIRHCKAASEENVTAINNPLTFNPQNQEKNEKQNTVLFVARMYDPQKNMSGFIDVWKKFHKKFPDWNAFMVGSGVHLERMKKYARKQKVKNLTFTGSVKNIREYYENAKIYCMTSTFEGWGMVLTEAMALGTVPVAFDSFEAVHDIIDHGKNGLLVAPFDKEGMADALSRLASDEDYRVSLASGGKEKIGIFKVSNIVDQWEKLFQSLVSDTQ